MASAISTAVIGFLIANDASSPLAGRQMESMMTGLLITLMVFAPLNGLAGWIVRKWEWSEWYRLPIIASFWLFLFSLMAITMDQRSSGGFSVGDAFEPGMDAALLTFCYAFPATVLHALFPHPRDYEE